MISSVLSDINMPSAKIIISSTASIAATAMVLRFVARDLIPYELQHYAYLSIHGFFKSFSYEIVLIIEEFDGLACNKIYKAAEIYLGSKVFNISAGIYKVSMPVKKTKISTLIAKDQQVLDKFNGVMFKWRQVTRHVESKQPNYSGDYTWTSIKLDHPATFDTLAMDRYIKERIVSDLERFVKRQDFYKKVGKAWKRGYLLYGPLGIGKLSLIETMDNYLKFEIYDYELIDIRANLEHKRLLL
ncbi:hypothetical protein CQW23_10007 [Capsicum baccatum]|uniref:AAA-type ATPase N-terminal domain-containing protein n=1 Tax=Capsicum baccatum TaxID=33114 RepID=A0A2G2WYI0_CAPBA|nr:hypothetical protein CQW23_10007 [Capsicum baccatum]